MYLNIERNTLLFAFGGVGGANDGTLVIDDDDALNILVSLHSVESFFHF